jgi:hypothetical protein
LDGTQSGTWKTTKVVQLSQNFVHLAMLARSGAKFRGRHQIEVGMLMQVRLPEDEGRITMIHVLAIGIIYGQRLDSAKYRAAVIRRKPQSDLQWGVLETLNAGAFPDPTCCNVNTHTTHTRPLTTPSHHCRLSITRSLKNNHTNTQRVLYIGRCFGQKRC